jgi:hypothetical protein
MLTIVASLFFLFVQIGNSLVFEQFVQDVATGPHSDEYRLTAAGASKRESRSGDYMDLS